MTIEYIVKLSLGIVREENVVPDERKADGFADKSPRYGRQRSDALRGRNRFCYGVAKQSVSKRRHVRIEDRRIARNPFSRSEFDAGYAVGAGQDFFRICCVAKRGAFPAR